MTLKKIALLTGAFFALTFPGKAQSWEPQTNITGYVATEFNYFDGIEGFARDYAMSVSEAGFLTIYKPTEDITLKGVLVYRPKYNLDQIINEINAEYKVSNFLNLKAGRFLTPLSPMNTYYYAPVNSSATLPMIVTNHEFFPLNMDAVSINGQTGDNFKFNYEVFAGGFRNSLWQESGALGFFSKENDYFTSQLHPTLDAEGNVEEEGYDTESNPNASMQFGGGAHVGVSYGEFLRLGFGYFNSQESISSITKIARPADMTWYPEEEPYYEVRTQEQTTSMKKTSFGGNLRLKHGSLQLLGEYWQTTVTQDENPLAAFGIDADMDQNYQGAFVELSNNFGKFIPYVRYEYHEVPGQLDFMTWEYSGQDYYRYTGGVNYKPTFETSFKLEYLHYEYEDLTQGGIVATAIFSF